MMADEEMEIDGVVLSADLAKTIALENGQGEEAPLFAMEAQWIMSVLEDTAQCIQLNAFLTSDILEDKIMDAVDHELAVALREHLLVCDLVPRSGCTPLFSSNLCCLGGYCALVVL